MNVSARLHGRLSCMWAIYRDTQDASVSSSSEASELVKVGEADSGEPFTELVLSICKDAFCGSMFIFRKHVQPCCEELALGGHFRVEQPLNSSTDIQASLLDKYNFICDVVEERLQRSSMIAGVGLTRQRQSLVMSLWTMSTDSSVVQELSREITKRVAIRFVIRFIHHSTVPRKDAQTGRRTLSPFLNYLANPGINLNDLPLAHDVPATSPPTSTPSTLQTSSSSHRKRSIDNGEASVSPIPHESSFNAETGAAFLIGRTSSSMSVFEHYKQSTDSAGGLLPAPTPVTDWGSNWSPSMFVAAQAANQYMQGSLRRSSTSSESGVAGSKEHSTPNELAISPPIQVVPAPTSLPPAMQVFSSAAFTNASNPLVAGPAQSNGLVSSSGPTVVVATRTARPFTGLTTLSAPYQQQQTMISHLSVQNAPYHNEQATTSFMTHGTVPASIQPQQYTYTQAFSYPPAGGIHGGNGGPSGISQPMYAQAPMPQFHMHPMPQQAMSPNAPSYGSYAAYPALDTSQQQQQHTMPRFTVVTGGNSGSTQQQQASYSTMQHAFTTLAPPPPPPPPPPMPTQQNPMQYHVAAQTRHNQPRGYHNTVPPQSDRRPFIFNGMVYPPGMNRKEYRQIVHHGSEVSVTCPSAFPAPPASVDGDLDLRQYETMKAEHLLARVRM